MCVRVLTTKTKITIGVVKIFWASLISAGAHYLRIILFYSWRVCRRKSQMKWWTCKSEAQRATVPPSFILSVGAVRVVIQTQGCLSLEWSTHPYDVWSFFSQCSSFLRSENLTMLRDTNQWFSVLRQFDLAWLVHRRRTILLRDRTCVICS